MTLHPATCQRSAIRSRGPPVQLQFIVHEIIRKRYGKSRPFLKALLELQEINGSIGLILDMTGECVGER